MKTDFEKALDYVRNEFDMDYINYMVCKAMEMRCPISCVDPILSDTIVDILEEYGQDNDLPESWWCEYGDINDIIEQI